MRTLLVVIVALIATFNVHASRAATSGEILQAQQELNAASYNVGTPDGVIGQHNTNALRAFQTAHGLVSNGVLTDETLNSLSDASTDLILLA